MFCPANLLENDEWRFTFTESLVSQSLNFSCIIILIKHRTPMSLSLSCHSSLDSGCSLFSWKKSLRKEQQPEGSSMCNRKKNFDRFLILIMNENDIRENSTDINLKELCQTEFPPRLWRPWSRLRHPRFRSRKGQPPWETVKNSVSSFNI